jgi:hypothetical protein
MNLTKDSITFCANLGKGAVEILAMIRQGSGKKT